MLGTLALELGGGLRDVASGGFLATFVFLDDFELLGGLAVAGDDAPFCAEPERAVRFCPELEDEVLGLFLEPPLADPLEFTDAAVASER